MKNAMMILLIGLCAAVLAACGGSADTLASPTSAPVDLDPSALSGTVVYSQVFDMTQNPGNYAGKRVRVKGSFSYFQDPDTKKEYFAAVIADATACCAQGIEFVRAGNHAYPADYPPLDAEITVTGTFDTYEEYGYTYLQLVDAEVEWEGRA